MHRAIAARALKVGVIPEDLLDLDSDRKKGKNKKAKMIVIMEPGLVIRQRHA
jgi:hypothetical protein